MLRAIYHVPGFLLLRKEEHVPELFPQTAVTSYAGPHRTQVADRVVSPSYFMSSPSSSPFSWCLCQSYSRYVVFESCNVSRPSMHSIFFITPMMSLKPVLGRIQVLRLWSRRVMPSMLRSILRGAADSSFMRDVFSAHVSLRTPYLVLCSLFSY